LNSIQTPKHAWLVLNAISHIGPVNLRRLLDAFDHDPLSIFEASLRDLMDVKGIGDKAAFSIKNWWQSFDLEHEMKKLEEANARFISHKDVDYPEILGNLYDPPIGLYQKGDFVFKKNQPAIAIVGSRNTTLYGLRIARQFAQRLASMGFCIVSGLARGVDTAAHEGALEAGGDTVAVLGNGLDIIYPPENLELYRRIADSGAVISEFCFGRRADRQTFPMRNRIVSGLSDGVLVVESDENGGSMITAKFAIEQNRQVYAIPGRIDQSTSRGCHRLIKEGAILTTSVEDILEDLKYRIHQPDLFESVNTDDAVVPFDRSFSEENSTVVMSTPSRTLEGATLVIYETLKKEGSLTVDELVEVTDLDVSSLNANLMVMELQKLVTKQLDGSFSLR